jgi:ABC-type polysaccharide/polyol phosphate export permease
MAAAGLVGSPVAGIGGDASTPAITDVRRPRVTFGQLCELVMHLTKRELATTHRGTLLGWTWPLVRQLVQLVVLVFVFSRVVPLGISDYPVFVFSGLIAWTWFANALGSTCRSLLAERHLVFQPRFPALVLPVVGVSAPLADVFMALPVLIGMLLLNGNVPWTVALFPLLLLAQLALMVGLAWITAALSVYLRDVPNLVGLALLLTFYVTPVYFALGRVPARYASLLRLNPLATLIESYRSVLLGQPFPPAGVYAATVAGCILVAVGGYALFRRLEHGFVDEL